MERQRKASANFVQSKPNQGRLPFWQVLDDSIHGSFAQCKAQKPRATLANAKKIAIFGHDKPVQQGRACR